MSLTLNKDEYFKLAKANGFDCHTGQTINFRENIGKTVRVPKVEFPDASKPECCSNTVIHATKDPLAWLIYARLPCSIFVVKGKPVSELSDKAGFKSFKVLREIPQEQFNELLGFNYSEAIKPFDPRTVTPPTTIDERILEELAGWASVWASVRDSVWASVRDSAAAYIGTLFPQVKEWKYVENKAEEYPYQNCVNLLKMGLVPAYDSYNKTYYLCGGSKMDILWKGSKDLVRSLP